MTARSCEMGPEMRSYEYMAVPAPRQVPKVKGVKGAASRFAHGMTELLNTWAAEGWEFVRSETLPSEERSGLMSKKTEAMQTILVFRREIVEQASYPDPARYAEPAPTPEELARELPSAGSTQPPADPAPAPSAPAAPQQPTLTARREGPARLRPVPGPDAPRTRG